MKIELKPIGRVQVDVDKVPRHWTVSEVEGRLIIDEQYLKGLKDIRPGQRIVVLFCFHQSPPFTQGHLVQTPPHRQEPLGVFSICSPVRPNPLGLSVLEVLGVEGPVLLVRRVDMRNGTPILDIKPYIEDEGGCPSREGKRNPHTP